MAHYSTDLFLAALNFGFLLSGEELAHFLVPVERPLINHSKLPGVCLEPVVNVAAQVLAHTCQNTDVSNGPGCRPTAPPGAGLT